MLELLRNGLFWKLDKFRGGNVARHLKEVTFLNENYITDEAARIRQQYLNNLLEEAEKNCSFYKGLTSFEQFPVINKNKIRDNQQAFSHQKYTEDQLHRVSTSGSTGVPFVVYQDKVKRWRTLADNLYFNRMFGFHLGNKLYYLRIWNEINSLSPLNRFLKNIVQVEASELTVDYTQNLIEDLKKDKSPKSILAYSSTLQVLARNIEELGVKPLGVHLSCIITMAEALDMHSRKILQKAFGCPVVSRYSNSENGFIAHQFASDNENYLINTASYHVELLQLNQDKPAEDGELGRIVITDLFNFATPMIRYDTGDIGRKGVDIFQNHPILVLEKIEGRRLDFISDTQGNLISPHVIDYAVRTVPGILQFQFIQEDAKIYRVKINSDGGKSINEKLVIEGLKKYIGGDSQIVFEYVNEIPLLASGKRKIVINDYRSY